MRFDPADCRHLRTTVASVGRLDGSVVNAARLANDRCRSLMSFIVPALNGPRACLIRRAPINAHQSIRVRIRQRVEQRRLDDGEYGCVDADPQRQCDREPRTRSRGRSPAAGPRTSRRRPSDRGERCGRRGRASLWRRTLPKRLRAARSGVCLAHARANVLTSNGVDVKRHLLIHLRVLRIPSEDGQDAAKQSR